MAPQEKFEGEEADLRVRVDPRELRLVLHDLTSDVVAEERAEKSLPSDLVTAEAIAETLDLPIEDVYAAIARVRRHDVREHVSKVLSELEEPTHRVERPGHSQDPLLTHYGFRRDRVFNSVLDRLPRSDKREDAQNKAKAKDREHPLAIAIILIVTSGLFATVAYAVSQMLQRR